MASQKVSHFITSSVLGIDVNERYSRLPQDLDDRAKKALAPADIYLEDEPSVAEWFKELAPSKAGAIQYVHDLFPFATWISRYGLNWLLGDVIAGKFSPDRRITHTCTDTVVLQASLLVWSSSLRPWLTLSSPNLHRPTVSTHPSLVPCCTGSSARRKTLLLAYEPTLP